jgi:hypothetical protein
MANSIHAGMSGMLRSSQAPANDALDPREPTNQIVAKTDGIIPIFVHDAEFNSYVCHNKSKQFRVEGGEDAEAV